MRRFLFLPFRLFFFGVREAALLVRAREADYVAESRVQIAGRAAEPMRLRPRLYSLVWIERAKHLSFWRL